MTADFSAQPVDLAKEVDFWLGPIQVRPSTRQVEAGASAETFEPRIMQVLVVLARRRGQVVSRDELIRTCWEGRIVGEDALNRCTSKIRKLGEAHNAFRLETIPRVGYRLWAADAKAAELALIASPVGPDVVSPAAQSTEATGAFPPRKRAWFSLPVVAVAVALVAVLIAGVIYLGIRNTRAATVAAPPIVAVLPFDTWGDETLKTFAMSVADQVSSVMSRHQLLASPPANFASLSRKEQLTELERIGASFVLDGIVQKDGDDLRVNVHLNDARASITLWSRDFRRASSQSSAFSYQVASHAADILRCALITRRPKAGDIPAHTLTLFLNLCDRVQQFENDSTNEAEVAKQVTKSAPEFSFGWSMLAMALVPYVDTSKPDVEANRQKVRDAAQRALQLDPANGEAYIALARILPYHDWPGRHRLLQKAIDVQPDFSDAYAWMADLMLDVGRMGEARDLCEKAATMDGISPNRSADLVRALVADNQFDRAHALREKLYEYWPDSAAVAGIRYVNSMFSDDPPGALKIMEQRAVSQRGSMDGPWIDYLKARVSGRAADLKAAADKINGIARQYVDVVPMAIMMDSAIGKKDEALTLAKLMYDKDPNADTWFLFFPRNSVVRTDPKMIGILEQVGLLDYWRTTGIWPDFCQNEPKSVCEQLKAGRPN